MQAEEAFFVKGDRIARICMADNCIRAIEIWDRKMGFPDALSTKRHFYDMLHDIRKEGWTMI